jgi:hypothetical protein
MKYLMLWHYYDANGKLLNASSTHCVGTLEELNSRLREECEANRKKKERGEGPVICQQIIVEH